MVRVGQKLGKYKIKRRIARGGFGEVFAAYDTVEQIHVALKIALDESTAAGAAEDLLHEVRITAKLQHENILPIKNADYIGPVLVLAQPLGEQSLATRMRKRMSFERRMDYASQLLAGVAHAHLRRVMHRDIKPDNVILFADGSVRLADFGIAKSSRSSSDETGSGSLGYIAPEQALGKPTLRSDVFSLGLVIHELVTGSLPVWPFRWPVDGCDRLRRHHPDLGAFIRRAIEVDARKRYRDADVMRRAFEPVKRRALRHAAARRARSGARS